MKLQKFIKNKKQKQIAIGSIVGILLLIGGINLYRAFALYKEEKTFNVLEGKIPDFSKADIKLAVIVDGKEQEIPTKESGNYKVSVECDNGATGSWNYSKWVAEVKDFKKGTKCDVTFTTTTDPMPSTPYEKGSEIMITNFMTGEGISHLKIGYIKNGLYIEDDIKDIKHTIPQYSDDLFETDYNKCCTYCWTIKLKKDVYVNGVQKKTGDILCDSYQAHIGYYIYIPEE